MKLRFRISTSIAGHGLFREGSVIEASTLSGDLIETLRRGGNIELIGVPASVPEKASPEVPEESDWPLATSPAEYLKRYPDGPKAHLAREILEDAD